MTDRLTQRGPVSLSVSDTGEGPPVLLAHGLTATKRYVVMGSTALQRSGHRVIAYDARGHGASSPAGDPEDYTYAELGGDMEAVLDDAGVERAVLAGVSMGAHTIAWMALHRPERIAGLVFITPAFNAGPDDPARLAHWDALAAGLRDGGIDGFLAAYGADDLEHVPERWRETVVTVIRQRLALHQHPEAVADALRAVPRSRPFGSMDELASIAVPTVVVASDDEADPEHPRAVGEAYAAHIPGARLITDEPGKSPVAWQGSQMSKIIAGVVQPAGL